jgi:hypothetical protein
VGGRRIGQDSLPKLAKESGRWRPPTLAARQRPAAHGLLEPNRGSPADKAARCRHDGRESVAQATAHLAGPRAQYRARTTWTLWACSRRQQAAGRMHVGAPGQAGAHAQPGGSAEQLHRDFLQVLSLLRFERPLLAARRPCVLPLSVRCSSSTVYCVCGLVCAHQHLNIFTHARAHDKPRPHTASKHWSPSPGPVCVCGPIYIYIKYVTSQRPEAPYAYPLPTRTWRAPTRLRLDHITTTRDRVD